MEHEAKFENEGDQEVHDFSGGDRTGKFTTKALMLALCRHVKLS